MNNSYFWNKKTIVSYFLSVLVFCIHCSSFANYDTSSASIKFGFLFFENTINRVAVPLFFIIAGALFFRDYTNEKYKEKLFRRVKTLVIPYVIWNVLNMLFDIFASMFFSDYFIGREKTTASLQNILLGIFHYKYNGPFWFVFALIVFVIASPIIDKLLYSKFTSMISIIAFIILCHFGIGLPQPLFFDKTCIIFYLFGGFVGRYYFNLFSKRPEKRYQIISFIVVILAIVYYMLLNYAMIGSNTIIDIILLIVFSVCFWYSFDLFLQDDIIVREYATHSFWVFALHINVGAVVTKLLYLLLPKDSGFCYVNFVLTTLLTLSVIEIACYAVKKISPRLYVILSGSR